MLSAHLTITDAEGNSTRHTIEPMETDVAFRTALEDKLDFAVSARLESEQPTPVQSLESERDESLFLDGAQHQFVDTILHPTARPNALQPVKVFHSTLLGTSASITWSSKDQFSLGDKAAD
jgi:hypothetical protein